MQFGVLSLAYLARSEGITIFSLRPFPVAFFCSVFLREAFPRKQAWACGNGEPHSSGQVTAGS